MGLETMGLVREETWPPPVGYIEIMPMIFRCSFHPDVKSLFHPLNPGWPRDLL